MASQDSQGFTWHYTELDDRNLEIRGRTFFFVVVLFSIILIMTLLFLYARWIWRYRGQHSVTYHSNGARLAAPAPPPAQGLDPATIKKLPIVLHHRTSDANSKLEETECCICLGAFKDGEKLKVLPGCDHSFHCECVDKWLSNHSSCPLCRSSLKLAPLCLGDKGSRVEAVGIDNRIRIRSCDSGIWSWVALSCCDQQYVSNQSMLIFKDTSWVT